jgi:cytochrome c-type biogenesis protein CcmH/NrfG
MKMSDKNSRKCIDPKIGLYINDYQYGWFKEGNPAHMELKRKFEQHLRECGYCATDIEFWTSIREVPQKYPNIWPDTARADEQPGSIASRFRRLLLAAGPFGRTRPLMLAAASLVLVVLLLPAYLYLKDPDYAQMAVLTDPTVTPRVNEGPDAVEEARGLGRQGDYRGAATILEQVIKKDPDDVRAALYLGYCYLKQNRNADGITVLQKAAALTDGPMDNRRRWLLANGYLRAGQVGKAENEFEELVKRGREHSTAAREMLEKISKLKGK